MPRCVLPPLNQSPTLLPPILLLRFFKQRAHFLWMNQRHGQRSGILTGPGLTRQIPGKVPPGSQGGDSGCWRWDIGITPLPSPSRGSCQHLGLHLGPDKGVGAGSLVTQLSQGKPRPGWLQPAYSKMHLPHHNTDAGFLRATAQQKPAAGSDL